MPRQIRIAVAYMYYTKPAGTKHQGTRTPRHRGATFDMSRRPNKDHLHDGGRGGT